MSLAHIFRSSAPAAVVAGASDAELDALLAGRYGAAKAAWPGVELPAESFVRHVAERVPATGAGKPLAQVLDGMALSDLYLACACAQGIPAASQALEAAFIARLPRLLETQFRGAPSATVDD